MLDEPFLQLFGILDWFLKFSKFSIFTIKIFIFDPNHFAYDQRDHKTFSLIFEIQV